MRLFDSTPRWALWSGCNLAAALPLHVILSGWTLPFLPFFNAYNWQPNGPYLTNIAHFWAGYILAALIMNLALPRSRKTILILGLLMFGGLIWEFLEILQFGLPTGEIDTLLDMTCFGLGGLVGIYHAEKSIP